MDLAYWTLRVANGLRKVAAGLRPFGESVWPGVPNDLFVAHASIYHFAGRFAPGARVLDAGCGTGYGAPILLSHGAAHVRGVDIDPFSVAFARRRFGGPYASFERADCQHLRLEDASFDLVFASNVLEHLEEPGLFLRSAFRALRPGGRALFAVPPITSEETARVHRDIHYHRSNLEVGAWHALVSDLPWVVSVHAHSFRGRGAEPDFRSPRRSVLGLDDFQTTPSSVEEISLRLPITAILVAERPALGHSATRE
jgi:SAM-dependent methyltransferase